jgi:uncharacterized protein (DUF1800 family)
MKSFENLSPEKFTNTFDEAALKHLLQRTTLGFRIKDFNALKGKTLDQVLAELFKTETLPLPPVNHYESQGKDITGVALGQPWINATYGDGTLNSRRRQSLRAWWITQMHTRTATIHEKINLFWHNHFATEMDVYDDARFGYFYLKTIQSHGLGNFKSFVKAISIDPAMLTYLNGNRNTKAAPDENYARELLELFTLGKGPNVKYHEADVKNAAKILTGYRITKDTSSAYFQADRHDTSTKTFSEYFNKTSIAGQTGENGQAELDELLAMLFLQDEVSLFIVRKLYIFFFYYQISPEVEKQFIEPLALFFRQQNFEILPLLKKMFASQHFFDASLRACLIKSPMEHIMSTVNMFEPEWPQKENFLYEYYLLANDLYTTGQKTEQALLDPPSVSGWPAYYQAPVFHEIWINATTFPERIKFTDNFIRNGLKRNGQTLSLNVVTFAKKLQTPQDPTKLIAELCFWLLQMPIAETLKLQMKKDFLLDGQASDYYWTELWNDHATKPNNLNTNMITGKLKNLISYLLSLPEYQLA